jgi:hypothetical protein
MKNRIIIDMPVITGHRISYNYTVEGEWEKAFKLDEKFYIEYSCDISPVSSGVAVVPLLANLLPMAWVYDAEVIAPVCDEDFYNSIPEFKKGYIDMYPMMQFGGKLTVAELKKNVPQTQTGVAAFFSGGVDAFNTLTQHADEKPTLLTLWGADVTFDDKIGWKNVEDHLKHTAKEFDLDYVIIKSCFRRFLNEKVLSDQVKKSGDGWWHGFQHGLGIISHAAPVAYVLGKSTVYIASSFTVAEKGKVTCASDPTIDNYIRFCSSCVKHDGYEFNRQMKIHNIVEYSRNHSIKIPLRVCWISKGGTNCCNCEKCWRTMLGIYAEGEAPRKYGFKYSNIQLKKLAFKMRFSNNKFIRISTYKPIQMAMKKNVKKNQLPYGIRWFYNVNILNLKKTYNWYNFVMGIRGKIASIYKVSVRRK